MSRPLKQSAKPSTKRWPHLSNTSSCYSFNSLFLDSGQSLFSQDAYRVLEGMVLIVGLLLLERHGHVAGQDLEDRHVGLGKAGGDGTGPNVCVATGNARVDLVDGLQDGHHPSLGIQDGHAQHVAERKARWHGLFQNVSGKHGILLQTATQTTTTTATESARVRLS